MIHTISFFLLAILCRLLAIMMFVLMMAVAGILLGPTLVGLILFGDCALNLMTGALEPMAEFQDFLWGD